MTSLYWLLLSPPSYSAHPWLCACRYQNPVCQIPSILCMGNVVPKSSNGVEHHIHMGGQPPSFCLNLITTPIAKHARPFKRLAWLHGFFQSWYGERLSPNPRCSGRHPKNSNYYAIWLVWVFVHSFWMPQKLFNSIWRVWSAISRQCLPIWMTFGLLSL